MGRRSYCCRCWSAAVQVGTCLCPCGSCISVQVMLVTGEPRLVLLVFFVVLLSLIFPTPDSLCLIDCLVFVVSLRGGAGRSRCCVEFVLYFSFSSFCFSRGMVRALDGAHSHSFLHLHIHLSTCRQSLTSRTAHPITSHSLYMYSFFASQPAIPSTMVRTQTRIVAVHESITTMNLPNGCRCGFAASPRLRSPISIHQ